MFLVFVLLRPRSSYLLLFSKYAFFLCHLYSVFSQDPVCFICFIFRISYFLGWRVCRILLPGTSAFDLPTYLDKFAIFVFCFLCLAICDHIIFILLGLRIRTDTGCTADVG